MQDNIRYYFPTEELNITRIILRSFGLYIVVFPHMIIGMTVVALISVFANFFASLIISQPGILTNASSILMMFKYSVVFYSLVYYFWTIKWIADHTIKNKFEFLRFFVRNIIKILIANLFLNSIVLLTAPFLFFPLVFIIPLFVFLLPLCVVSPYSVLRSIKISFKLIWGNWYFLISAVISLFAIVIIISALLSGQGFILFENYNFSLMMNIYRWYIVMPFLAGFILLLLNNALLRKNLPPLARLKPSPKFTLE